MTDEAAPGGGPPLIDAAALRERQHASRARIQEAQRRAEQARATLAERRHCATSADRAVTVTVDAAGTLVDLAFAASAAKLAPAALAHTVLATYRAAARDAVRQTEQTVHDLLGGPTPALDLIRASLGTEDP